MYKVNREDREMIIDIMPVKCPHCGDIIPIEVALKGCGVEYLNLSMMSTSSWINSAYPQIEVDTDLDVDKLKKDLPALIKSAQLLEKFMKTPYLSL